MRQLTVLTLVLCSLNAAPALAEDIVNYTMVPTTVGEDGSRIVEMPAVSQTRRRRMLVDLGLFGAGIHIGWLKPRNAEPVPGACGGWGFGSPVFNVSAGTHAIGLGTK